jgi:DNA polymerase-3 subunit alpha
MENALETTYGVLVYQEQVMQISKDLCGFTGGQADTLRKGIGKKIPEVLAKMKVEFIEGAMKHSDADRGMMEKFWKQLEDFAAYCFNKSHAACYALIAYQTAYLKAHYPAAFMAALMTSDYDDTDRLSIEISECKHMGIDVLPPDVNESFVEFAVVPGGDKMTDSIRFGMNAIKNVGTGAVEEILRAREVNGPFESLDDFFSKVNPRIVNRKALESLIKSGGFDRYLDRSTLLGNLDGLLAFASRAQKDQASGQTDLFGNAIGDSGALKPRMVLGKVGQVFTTQEQLQWERELLGLYLSEHPLKAYEIYLTELTMPLKELKPEMDNKTGVVGGTITAVREITTKNGQKMAFVKLADLTGEIELILFPNAYQQTTGIWERDRVVLVRGKINGRDRQTGSVLSDIKILVDEAREITEEQATTYQETGKKQKLPSIKNAPASASKPSASISGTYQKLYIRLEQTSDHPKLLALKQVIDTNNGDTAVVLVLGPASRKQVIQLPNKTLPSDTVLSQIRELVGESAVVLK